MSRNVRVGLPVGCLLSVMAAWVAAGPAAAASTSAAGPSAAGTAATGSVATGTAAVRPAAPAGAAQSDALAARARALFAAANAYWSQDFVALGGHYPPPMLMLFSGRLAGVCGLQQALTGPFYCADSEVVYLDESFLQQAVSQTAGNDDAALAYVIGHEIAHHVQNLVGTTAVVNEARSRSTPALSARTWMADELQADCYAALWLQSAVRQGLIRLADPAALLDGIAAVSHQQEAHPSSTEVMADPVLSYGTPAQRLEWFRDGLSGKGFASCDTFSAESAGKL